MADLLTNKTDLEAHGSDTDLAWETFLPPHYEDILAQAPDAPPNTSSKKEIHDYLSNRVLIQNGTQEFWLDPASQGVCQSIGARSLSIASGGDTRYWDWRTQEGARYSECAYLKSIYWFDVRAKLQCYLSPGTYTLSWRVLIDQEEMYGWDEGPVQFSFETTDSQRVDTEYSLSAKGRQVRVFNDYRLGFNWVRNNWMEIEVGEFTVGAGDHLVGLKFSMSETGAHWKGGMFLDCVMIHPTSRDKEASIHDGNEEQGGGSDSETISPAGSLNARPNAGEGHRKSPPSHEGNGSLVQTTDLLTNTDLEAHGSDTDLAWETFLPPHYEDILAQAPDAPPNTSSKKEIHDYLCNRVFIQNGTQEFWLDPASQGVCQSIGARSLSITWGDDTRYWDWRTQEGARYPECAYLKSVSWLDISGELLCYLSPGMYTLSWRVLLDEENMAGWEKGEIEFLFETTDGQRHVSEYSISANGREDRVFNDYRLGFNWVRNDWMEIEVGEFTVGARDRLVKLKFSMSETGGHWKGGMYLDCVMIHPTSTDETSIDDGNEGLDVGSDSKSISPTGSLTARPKVGEVHRKSSPGHGGGWFLKQLRIRCLCGTIFL